MLYFVYRASTPSRAGNCQAQALFMFFKPLKIATELKERKQYLILDGFELTSIDNLKGTYKQIKLSQEEYYIEKHESDKYGEEIDIGNIELLTNSVIKIEQTDPNEKLFTIIPVDPFSTLIQRNHSLLLPYKRITNFWIYTRESDKIGLKLNSEEKVFLNLFAFLFSTGLDNADLELLNKSCSYIKIDQFNENFRPYSDLGLYMDKPISNVSIRLNYDNLTHYKEVNTEDPSDFADFYDDIDIIRDVYEDDIDNIWNTD